MLAYYYLCWSLSGTVMAESSIRIKPFDGSSDFAMWQLKMKAIFIKEKCWTAIEKSYVVGTTKIARSSTKVKPFLFIFSPTYYFILNTIFLQGYFNNQKIIY